MKQKLAAFAARGDEPIAGTVSVGDGETFDVGEALEEGDGTIVVVADSLLDHSLKEYPGVKSVSVPEGATPINAEVASVDDVEVKASKTAKEKAAKAGIDLSTVEGTAKDGSITIKDVEAAIEKRDADAENGGGS